MGLEDVTCAGRERMSAIGRPTWLLAALAALAEVPFAEWPLSPDEGGFLLVASQWHPGPSLYGHYWVDRPPVLVTLFDLADHLGGATGLRLIGTGVVVSSVLLTSVLTGLVARRRALTPTLVAAIFISTPLFGTEVDGELLSVPFVLLGMVCLARACRAAPLAAAWAACAGIAGMAAALVKQNVVDVFVVAAVLLGVTAASSGSRRALVLAAGVAAGATGFLDLALAMAEIRGTEPSMLWDALVVFRAHAASVIQASATSSTSNRMVTLLVAAVLSGGPLVVVVLVLGLRGPVRVASATGEVVTDRLVPDLRLPALAVLAWELTAVAGGGSYWLHYLVGLVPGMVLLAVAAAQRGTRLRRSTGSAVAFALTSCLTALVVVASAAPPNAADLAVASYLRSHGSPGDSVVVGFGHPNIVYESGLHSPYEQLWSLPVRVRDSSLSELTRVLRGRRAPTWVVVSGPSLATWGVDATTAQRVLDADYRRATSVGPYVVWHRTTAASQVPGR
ncbi:hypothetical protein [Nocardioides sp.]|uniref:hypothetical protein n=1 Tax=Nocardioides sp. TaxID=35761 RepID=UPI0026121DF4|nr:hypothetical protein [Nocardioides sp.]MCW2737247.1 hypothetical protein [Nocardioides sp.]